MRSRTIAVVGLSSRPERPSNRVALFLKKIGYHIFPVNPNETNVLEEKAYPDLASVPSRIDIVDVFRRASAAAGITEEAVAIGAHAVWLQLGVISPEAYRIGIENGLVMVMDKCIAIEYPRLIN